MTHLLGTHRVAHTGRPVTWKGNGKAVEESGLRKACAEFESIFIHYMLRAARKALPEDGLFDHTNESKIYKSMMDEQLAHVVTKGRGVGLAALLYDGLSGAEAKAPVDGSQYA